MKLPTFILIATVAFIGLSACQSTQTNRQKTDFKTLAVEDFDVQRYMGKWYEVARFDFKWQKNLKNVTADYTLQNDGSIQVDNQGSDITTLERKQSIGKAKSNGNANNGALKVSFFGPFYSEYNVVQLDPDYRYALIFGENNDYMWLLSREKTMPDSVKQKYLNFAQQSGYDLNRLVWTQQD
ncbi:lipocalin [Vitreoscilla sp. C1]|uniref:lipocalin family protein n=1 Tax=Vitreoscilla sp. (strain C1) TaxID=96942 RepID=UPI00148EA9F7|nr:lipocalin family protein [Vitreoscilla sp. C1]AUZ04648.2 lipocalin [Vitreoscilla sp. C1]